MKNNILTTVAIVALFLLSFDKATSLLTQRSKQQIIVHGTNIGVVVNQINQMYSQGYRVTSIVGQSVASVLAADNRSYPYSGERHINEYGEIIVIMEK